MTVQDIMLPFWIFLAIGQVGLWKITGNFPAWIIFPEEKKIRINFKLLLCS